MQFNILTSRREHALTTESVRRENIICIPYRSPPLFFNNDRSSRYRFLSNHFTHVLLGQWNEITRKSFIWNLNKNALTAMIHLCRRRWASRASRRTNQASGFAAGPVVSTRWSIGTTRVSTAFMHAFVAAACRSLSSSSSSSSILSLSRVCALPRRFGSIISLACYILSKIRRIHEMQICEIKTLLSYFKHPCVQRITWQQTADNCQAFIN